MSALLDDSEIATKHRDEILAEISTNENIFYVVEAHVFEEPRRGDYWAAVLVTSRRLLFVRSKRRGRAEFRSVEWTVVTKSGADELGRVIVVTPQAYYKIIRFLGKTSKYDAQTLTLLRGTISEARQGAATNGASRLQDDMDALRQRRGF